MLSVVETHHVSDVLQMGGAAPPPTLPLLVGRAKRASKPMNLVGTHHVSIVLQLGGGGGGSAPPPPPPPRLFSAVQSVLQFL